MLIPDHLDGPSSMGEKLVFLSFKEDKAADSFIVLHSLFISRHITNVSGEVDFLVLIPGHGIFCLEVKHGRVSRENGKWKFESRTGHVDYSSKGPFSQVNDAMYSVRNHLYEAAKKIADTDFANRIRKIIFGRGVMFTSLDSFNLEGIEADPWEIYTRKNKNFPISKYMLALSKGYHEKYADKFWYDQELSKPNEKDCQIILSLLRGDFSYNYREINKITDQEFLIEELTREQFDVLDLTVYNERCLIEGPAGTGKTLLALELFRRQSENGFKTALFCFNRLLGDKMKSDASKLSAGTDTKFFAGTLHAYMMKESNSIYQDTPDYFADILPFDFLIATESLTEEQKFDYIIVDEAQDLLSENYLAVFDAVLKGGLKNGKWCFFGDFDKQAIFLNEPDIALQRLASRAHFARHPQLKINCRNTEAISLINTLLTGVPKSKLNRMSDNFEALDDPSFVPSFGIAAKVGEIIKDLQKNNIPLSKITVLSARQPESSLLTNEYLSHKQKEGLAFHTIHSFKGLENSMIILTGFPELTTIEFQRLLYVGISRARIRLFLVFEEQLKPQYESQIKRNVNLLKY